MGWYDAVEAPGLLARRSRSESDRFGVSVDRVTVSSAARASLAAVQDAVAASDADVVVLRYPARETGWFAALAAGRRTALFADNLVYWSLKVGTGRRPEPVPELRAAVRTTMADALVDELVADIFAGYENHYCANPLFDRALAMAGYQEWARRSIASAGAVTLHATGTDRVLALATVDHVAETGSVTEIELAGVVTAEQGRGHYGRLLAGVEDAAVAAGSDRLVISTQSQNTGVQRAWARFGFEPVHALVTVHLVLPDLPAGGSLPAAAHSPA